MRVFLYKNTMPNANIIHNLLAFPQINAYWNHFDYVFFCTEVKEEKEAFCLILSAEVLFK